jgi:tRNA pseudouridine38-40 synthase
MPGADDAAPRAANADPADAGQHLLLLLAYDGSAYAGWWQQAGQRTVAGAVDAAWARLGESGIRCQGASRTDAGVHARGQVAEVMLQRAWEPRRAQHALDRHLDATCFCRAVALPPPGWQGVAAARSKTYVYTLCARPERDPWRHREVWQVPFALDLAALQAAAALIPGRHDWSAFRRRDESRDLEQDGGWRAIDCCTWSEHGPWLQCRVRGEGFLHHLVRSLVGAMVAVAHGSCSLDQLRQAVAGVANPASRQQAPAHGLCLETVAYASAIAWQGPGAPALATAPP